MLFASNIFLFCFLPAVVIIYYILPKRSLKNYFLLISSLLFYAYGEPKFVLIMLLSIIINYLVGIFIDLFKEKKKLSKLILIFGILYNILILFVFKYLVFTIRNINNLFKINFSVKDILLPIGISFFTFQCLSYIIDVYRRKINVQKNPFYLGLYISFFPQLIAGPIVRYSTIQEQICNRCESVDMFFDGIKRFIVGLGKKVIIANTMALIADYIFNLDLGVKNISTLSVWLGAIAYTLQIFYDFSGYSDMAIGLGKIFGFSFEENFNYPYISKSITEFWRRWHISLGTWFRDYVYIPLGGNRVKKWRLFLNLGIVWLLTGLWHGANWTFIIWGVLYFFLISFEKITDNIRNKIPIVVQYITTIFFVIIGWVLFRSSSISFAFNYIKRMFTFKNMYDLKFAELLLENIVILLFALFFCLPIMKKVSESKNRIVLILYHFSLVVVFIISMSYIIKGSYNPFIYFNF